MIPNYSIFRVIKSPENQFQVPILRSTCALTFPSLPVTPPIIFSYYLSEELNCSSCQRHFNVFLQERKILLLKATISFTNKLSGIYDISLALTNACVVVYLLNREEFIVQVRTKS